MINEIISYTEMCQREGLSLQAGMNFGVGGNHSVILMSVRPNAPYRDRIEDGGTTLIYEGHDQPRAQNVPDPKKVDQLDTLPTGNLTQNGKFDRAAQDAKAGRRRVEGNGTIFNQVEVASCVDGSMREKSIHGCNRTVPEDSFLRPRAFLLHSIARKRRCVACAESSGASRYPNNAGVHPSRRCPPAQ
jgi:hypothetical protein